MARRLRIEYPGAIHHVTCRGVERRALFLDDADRCRFLTDLGRATVECGLRLFLYCLMCNHVHLLLETPGANLCQFIHKLETAYAVYFNLRHQRAGHLMQGRYGAQLVQGNEYLLKLSRYIHLNPVFVRALRSAPLGERVHALRAYRWSSYREYLGIDAPIGFLETAPLLRLVGDSTGDRSQLYGQFVETGLAASDDEFRVLLKTSRWGIGDSEFRERLAGFYLCQGRQAICPEDVAFRQVRLRRSTEEVLRVVAAAFGLRVEELRQRRYRCRARATAARMLWVHAGLNQRDIGRELGMGTGAAVCQQLRTLELARASDEHLDQRLRQIDERLSLNS